METTISGDIEQPIEIQMQSSVSDIQQFSHSSVHENELRNRNEQIEEEPPPYMSTKEETRSEIFQKMFTSKLPQDKRSNCIVVDEGTASSSASLSHKHVKRICKALSSSTATNCFCVLIIILIFITIILQSIIIDHNYYESNESNTQISHIIQSIDSMQQEINYLVNTTSQAIDDNDDNNDNQNIKIDSNDVRLKDPQIYYSVETTISNTRLWNPANFVIYKGDTIMWTWESYENILEKDNNLNSTTHINSGDLKLNGKYEMTFNEVGIFHYSSQNSQTMYGVVRVIEGSFIHFDRDEGITINAVSITNKYIEAPSTSTIVYSGILKDVSIADNKCWKECFNQGYDTSLPSTFLDNCNGKWLFVGAKQEGKDKFAVGAYIEKTSIPKVTYYYTSDTVTPVLVNGAYWYYLYNTRSSSYHYTSFGFTSEKNSLSMQVTSHTEYCYGYYYCTIETYIYDKSNTNCENKLSWVSDSYYTGYVVGCSYTSSSSMRQIVLTNICEVSNG
jgi:plastocyanin